MRPSGPKATPLTEPSSTFSGAGRIRSPRRVEDHHATGVAVVTGGDAGLWAEGHAPDAALLDLQRRRADPLPRCASKTTTPLPAPLT